MRRNHALSAFAVAAFLTVAGGCNKPPQPVANLTVTTGDPQIAVDAARVSWENPPDEDLAAIEVALITKEAHDNAPYGTEPSPLHRVAVSPTEQSVVIGDVPVDEPVLFLVRAVDDKGNESSAGSVGATITPPLPDPEDVAVRTWTDDPSYDLDAEISWSPAEADTAIMALAVGYTPVGADTPREVLLPPTEPIRITAPAVGGPITVQPVYRGERRFPERGHQDLPHVTSYPAPRELSVTQDRLRAVRVAWTPPQTQLSSYIGVRLEATLGGNTTSVDLPPGQSSWSQEIDSNDIGAEFYVAVTPLFLVNDEPHVIGSRRSNRHTIVLRAVDAVRIDRVELANVDSVGGTSVRITFTNLLPQTLKYVDFAMTHYNRVNDLIRDDIDRDRRSLGRYTGPPAPGATTTGRWSTGYHSGAASAQAELYRIVFMDDRQLMVEDGVLR